MMPSTVITAVVHREKVALFFASEVRRERVSRRQSSSVDVRGSVVRERGSVGMSRDVTMERF